MNKGKATLAVMTAALGWGLGGGVQAQSGNVAVRDRPKPEYDPAGINIGTFKLYPELTLSAQQVDNVFGTELDPVEDTIYNGVASFELESQWAVHELNASFTARTSAYEDLSGNDTTDLTATLGGRLDIYRDFRLQGEASYGQLTEPLELSPSLQPLGEPTQYTRAAANLELVKEFSTVSVSVGGSYEVADYDDGVLFDLSPLEQDDRDREVVGASIRVATAVTPSTALFVEVSGNQRDYDLDPPDTAVNRDSEGYQGLVGATFDVTNGVTGEIGVGYMNQTFDEPGLEETSGAAVQAGLTWFPDNLVTVSVAGARQIGDAGVVGAASYVANNVSIGIDYEIQRNVILNVNGGFALDEYSGVDREDERWSAGARADVLVNRGVSLFVEAGHYEQRSEGVDAGREYDANRVMVGIRLRQ